MIFGAEGAEKFFRPLNIAENFSDFGHDPRKEKRFLHPGGRIRKKLAKLRTKCSVDVEKCMMAQNDGKKFYKRQGNEKYFFFTKTEWNAHQKKNSTVKSTPVHDPFYQC